MESNFTSDNLKTRFDSQIEFINLLNDPTRLRILLLLFLYKRLSLKQISQLVHRTQPAISRQLEKFINLGIIKITKRQVKGLITAKFYELIPDFIETATIIMDPKQEIPKNIIKEMEILQIKAKENLFKTISQLFIHYAELYKNLAQRAQDTEDSFGIDLPPFNLSILPLSNKIYKYYKEENFKLTQKVIELIKEEDEDENEDFERPVMLFNTILSVKDFLSFEGKK
ncbi:MAG: ArsR family transcriptional regulator [Promethearchaeota archaeon]